jgi:hypothetical protein
MATFVIGRIAQKLVSVDSGVVQAAQLLGNRLARIALRR